MKHLTLWLLVIATGLSPAAWAGIAYTQGTVNLRAGPSSEYPLVTPLPPGTPLQVNGCLDDYTWCDVNWEDNRGWVYGDYLYYDYQNRRVPVLQVGAALGIGIVAFSVGDYWGRYYVGRPWYGQRNVWIHRPPPPRRPYPHRPGFRPPGHGSPGHANPGHGGPARPPAHRPARPPPPRPGPPSTGRPTNRPGPGNGGRPNSGGAGRPGGATRPTPAAGRPAPGGGPATGSGRQPGSDRARGKPPESPP